MRDAATAHLKSLHTLSIDAKNGYVEAVKEAEAEGLSELFESMAELHARDERELAAILLHEGVETDGDGSLLTWVHKTIIDIRSLFGGLKESILPGLIDGETRILERYDAALADANVPLADAELLRLQRARLNDAVVRMRAMKQVTD